MLKFFNDYQDRRVTVVGRRIFDGTDGATTTVEPGQAGSIEIDGDHQLIFSSQYIEGKAAPSTPDIPAATIETFGAAELDDDDDDDFDDLDTVLGGAGQDSLTGQSSTDSLSGVSGTDTLAGASGADSLTDNVAGDDVVRGEINDMISTKQDLTRTGMAELPALNKRLVAKGFKPIDTKRRDSLSPAPAA